MLKDETEMRNGRCYKGWALALKIYLMPKADPSPCATQAIGLPRGLNKVKLMVKPQRHAIRLPLYSLGPLVVTIQEGTPYS
jgi:hypothetical protein